MKGTFPPGSTIGVFGSGQLGRMFAIAARRMGYRIHVFSPEQGTPAGQVADLEVQSAYDDADQVARLAKSVDVITFEFENIPLRTIEIAEQLAPIRPAGKVLHTTQERLREKAFLRSIGAPVTPFAQIRTPDDLSQAADTLFPGVLKTAAWGYDGKGQVRLESAQDPSQKSINLSEGPAVLEKFVDLECELSVVAARGADREVAHYDPILNTHQNHILDLSQAPSGLPAQVSREATEIASTILEELDVVGVACVEFFLTKGGELLVNEIAPRPHNSGHLTIDAHATCQFEQQVRAVCGSPLGSTAPLRPAAMVNLLGDLWTGGTPLWNRALAMPDVKLHLYGKDEPRIGRKMGHLTVTAETTSLATERALAARNALAQQSAPLGPAGLQTA